MSMQKRMLTRGFLLLAPFFAVLVLIFTPVFPGKMNGLDYMDNLFNMISKGSSYFIPQMKEDIAQLSETGFEAKVAVENDQDRQQMLAMLEKSGIGATAQDKTIVMQGNLHQLLAGSLEDADHLFANDSASVQEKYGFAGQQALFHWWTMSKGIVKDLKVQGKFKEVKMLEGIAKKAYEPAYNYYGVEPKKWQENVLLIVMALGFYVLYTLWYGFGIMYLFEGLGLRVGH